MSREKTIAEVLEKTDWALLAKQKLELVRQADNELATGLLHWIDALQDAAEAAGYPVVFLTDGECEACGNIMGLCICEPPEAKR